MKQTRRGFLGTIAAIAAAVPLAGKAEAAAATGYTIDSSDNLTVASNAAMTGTLTPGANLVSGKDDAAYIQGMIDQAHANGGGIVTLEPRQYRVSELMLPPDVRLDIPIGATVNGYDWSAHA